MSSSDPHGQARPVLLALQGGGTLGANTAGVLERLLEDGRLVFEGISETSAGAVNTVVLGHGPACNGAQGARAAPWQFWMRLSEERAARPRRWHSWLEECFDALGVKSALEVTWYTGEATDIPVGGSR